MLDAGSACNMVWWRHRACQQASCLFIWGAHWLLCTPPRPPRSKILFWTAIIGTGLGLTQLMLVTGEPRWITLSCNCCKCFLGGNQGAGTSMVCDLHMFNLGAAVELT